MSNINKNYFKNFLVAFGSGIGFAIAFLAFGLKFNKSIFYFFVILIYFVSFMIIFKLLCDLFNINIKINEVLDGVWGGLSLYCFSQIFTLSWSINFINAIKESIIFIIMSIVIFFFGMIFTFPITKALKRI
jgi:hypothetical protein